ncbi:MAG: DEAD/DEAH box helicase [Treponema sp.]|nr:DEAD/DEAH box helicase [Treponema sp.]
MVNPENPLVVQSDRSLMLDVHAPLAEECRNALIPFAELERSPEHWHTYKVTALSLWNAASVGISSQDVVAVLEKFSRYDVPQAVSVWIQETAERFGKIRLVQGSSKPAPNSNIIEEFLYLVCSSPYIFREIEHSPSLKEMLTACTYEEPENPQVELSDEEKKYCFILRLTDRGTIKQKLLSLNWPVKDDVPLGDGEHLDISLRETTSSGKKFVIRDYQKNAAKALVGNKGPGSGYGTIVLPCGAGKTIVGMELMDMLKTNTLIVTTNISAVHQWIDELVDKTTLSRGDIAEYTGENKEVKPVTVATYQILTWRPEKEGPYPHFSLFRASNWGLIIYDEVHMLPAPVFRVAAELQAVRRVGLTATLVREDGCEGNVFSLVGPKRYDVPWKELERDKWIASAECVEVRISMSEQLELEYSVASKRMQNKIASTNPEKIRIVKELVKRFPDDKILVIGQYLDQLSEIAKDLNAPIITGKTKNADRDAIYGQFRNGEIQVLVVSKVANFAIDLPDASMAIEVSGTFGSRQEEAQRLGRLLRPKERTARFFTVVTRGTVDEEFGSKRQKFLGEQGYSYRIIRYTDESSFDELEVLPALGYEGESRR